MPANLNRRFCIAPMMDCSDRHSRYFLRLFSNNILLYTEMVTAAAIVHGDRDYLLGFSEQEHPIAVQLGGADPDTLYRAAIICTEYGYDEINLNCGCPSDRVKSGSFGACLMADPGLVKECVAALKAAGSISVTVKHRTGIDKDEDYGRFSQFAEIQLDAGADALIVHARNAWLNGISPKQNREIPPLKYPWVYRLKKEFPEACIIINGGIKTLKTALSHLRHTDGVMLGREPYQNPYLLHEVDTVIFGVADAKIKTRQTLLQEMYPYIEQQLSRGVALSRIVRHLSGLYHGQPNAKHWRRYLSEQARRQSVGIEILHQAERLVS